MGLALVKLARFQREHAKHRVCFQRIRVAGQNAPQVVSSGSSRRRRWLDLGQQESGLPQVSGDIVVPAGDRGDPREQRECTLLFAERPATSGQGVGEFGSAGLQCQPLKKQSSGPVVAGGKGPFRTGLVT